MSIKDINRERLEEASAFDYAYSGDDIIRHKIVSEFVEAGTYHLYFYNDDSGFDDATEFYAENKDELEEFWYDFCSENDFGFGCLIRTEFVCRERI